MVTWNNWSGGSIITNIKPVLGEFATIQWDTLQDFQFQNGANNLGLQDEGLSVEFNKIGGRPDIKIELPPSKFYNNTYPSYFFDPDRDYGDKIRLRRIVELGVIKYRLEYSNLLRPYNRFATTYNDLYIEPSSTSVLGTPFWVFLKVKDANNYAGSLGMSTVSIYDSPSSVFVYLFNLTN